MRKVTVGPAGQRIARNVRSLREQQRISYVELSNRLQAAGRPIPILGIRRIEQTERRVDIDDLIALAETLNVPVERLAFDDDLTVEVRVVAGGAERAGQHVA